MHFWTANSLANHTTWRPANHAFRDTYAHTRCLHKCCHAWDKRITRYTWRPANFANFCSESEGEKTGRGRPNRTRIKVSETRHACLQRARYTQFAAMDKYATACMHLFLFVCHLPHHSEKYLLVKLLASRITHLSSWPS